MAVKIQFRRGTAAEWSAANPVLSAGEPGYATDTGVLKIGDGTTPWNGLPAFGGEAPAFSLSGGTVTTPGDGYVYHTFDESGILAVTGTLDVEYLVVGAGGGGAVRARGTSTPRLLARGRVACGPGAPRSSSDVLVLVGAGGVGGVATENTRGSNGSDSLLGDMYEHGRRRRRVEHRRW